MKGLYFYKLVSSYPEDITKDCKLTINEIDHNFITLKDADIRAFKHDESNKTLVLVKNSGEELVVDLSQYTTNLDVTFDTSCGVIEIKHDGIVDRMSGLITVENFEKEIQSRLKSVKATVMKDGTLSGDGSCGNPLGLNMLQETSAFKGVTKLVDVTKGEMLPKFGCNVKGDRYVTYENSNEYGYLYNFACAEKIAADLGDGWRLPSKEDWDDMLNTIELCSEDKTHHVSSSNITLGKMAGKYLKSDEGWAASDEECCCQCGTNDDAMDFEADNDTTCCTPKCKLVKPNGLDTYGFSVLPSGYGDGYLVVDYFTRRARFWTSTVSMTSDVYTKRFDYDKNGVSQSTESPESLSSVRLVKDYDGTNHQEYVTLNGKTYRTVLMPSTTAHSGYVIWLAANIADDNSKYKPMAPNCGDMASAYNKYYMCEWDGFIWHKKEMMEGDSVVMEIGVDGLKDNEYRLYHGQLKNVGQKIVEEVQEKYDTIIERVENSIKVLEPLVDELRADNEYIKGRLINQEGSYYDMSQGILTLATDNPENTIKIEWDSNYGTF